MVQPALADLIERGPYYYPRLPSLALVTEGIGYLDDDDGEEDSWGAETGNKSGARRNSLAALLLLSQGSSHMRLLGARAASKRQRLADGTAPQSMNLATFMRKGQSASLCSSQVS